MYEEFIAQLYMYAKAIRILSKGYLPISLISPNQNYKKLEMQLKKQFRQPIQTMI